MTPHRSADSAIAGDPRFFARQRAVRLRRWRSAAAAGRRHGGPRRMTRACWPAWPRCRWRARRDLSFLDNRRYADALSATRAGCDAGASRNAASRAARLRIAIVTDGAPIWAGPGSPPCSTRRRRRMPRGPRTACRRRSDGVRVDPHGRDRAVRCCRAGAEIGPRCRIGAGSRDRGRASCWGRTAGSGAGQPQPHHRRRPRLLCIPARASARRASVSRSRPTGFLSVPQLGRVILEDDVEVGANTTIDRGSIGDTVIGAGSRLDNLVQIGHNVRLGRLPAWWCPRSASPARPSSRIS